jgi:hypothetical protein
MTIIIDACNINIINDASRSVNDASRSVNDASRSVNDASRNVNDALVASLMIIE